MTAAYLVELESRRQAVLDRYRQELVDGTDHGIPSLVWPGSTGHGYFAAIERGTNAVGLHLIIADGYRQGSPVGAGPQPIQLSAL